MSTAISVKLQFQGETRRFTVPNNISYQEFLLFVNGMYNSEAIANGTVSVSYLDDEGDLIRVTREDEWKHALDFTPKQGVFRVQIQDLNAKPKPAAAVSASTSQQQQPLQSSAPYAESLKQWFQQVQQYQPQQPGVVIHQNVTCDACDTKGIRGTRYKCIQCPNYDLCCECYVLAKEVHDPSHTFRAIEQPESFQSHYPLHPQMPQNWLSSLLGSLHQSMVPPTHQNASAPFVQNSEEKWKEQLSTLASMGFVDTQTNIALLNNCQGNVNAVIEKLVAGMQ